ncbi:uncharacterized protein N7459_001667 [Penicillium hispanicum]|uniref:uncharacterized protein n=1 Tax=Penicillium hispanicum TaxID=1080232 RepID=UPI0025416920|nr:uncharacterized protein N7459_001667 [Penicillium hispanicum]KAJ5595459.1 hypothetical protein N7459_001667 [Penicillium hispanicum]
MSFPNVHGFTKPQIQALASGYANGNLIQWGQRGLIQDVLELDSSHDPAIVALAWDLNELLGHLVCIIGAGSPQAWILRILLAPEFIWLGLHWAGTPETVSLGEYYNSLVDAIRHRPLVAAAMLQHALQFDPEWLELLAALEKHFGGLHGSLAHATSANLTNLPTSDSLPLALPAVSPGCIQMDDSEMEICPVTPTAETSVCPVEWSMDWTTKDVTEEGDEIL